ncbi:MAG: ANTAR domain-containing protein, partial [Trebonia sp.]
MAHGEDVPRLSAVVMRQRRELARVRSDRESTVVVAMARGVLIERHGLAPAEAARQLAAMATAAGLPEPEMAAAVLAQEPPCAPDSPKPDPPRPDQAQADGAQADRSRAAPREWIEAGKVLGPAADMVAIASAERAKDGAELVGALADQLRSRFGVSAVAVWLLDADGALDLFGQDGLGGTESSRWRRLPPQFDCLEQRVIADGTQLWWPAGLPAADQVPAAAPWGRGAARVVLGLRDRAGVLLGVAEAWWPTPRGVFDVKTRVWVAAAAAGFADVLGLRLAYGPVGSTAPSLPIFRAVDEITES